MEGAPPTESGLPMRKWTCELSVLGPNDQELPANIFDKVTYKLHPTFKNPTLTVKKPPFKIEEEGWGEFDMGIVLHFADKGGEQTIGHDLNFAQNEYIVNHTINVPTNKPNLARLLTESGPVPGYNAPGASGVGVDNNKRKVEDGAGDGKVKKKTKTFEKASIDLEKLADGLQKLSEDDLLGVVQMVTDNKTNDMYVKNDVDEGEFHMDLYTLPESLLKSLWDYVRKRVEV